MSLTLRSEVILVAVVSHARLGRSMPITDDDYHDVAWWIGQLFDGPRHVVQRVYRMTNGELVDVSAEFAACVANYVGDNDPDFGPWPDDMVDFVERYPAAAAVLQHHRDEWDRLVQPALPQGDGRCLSPCKRC